MSEMALDTFTIRPLLANDKDFLWEMLRLAVFMRPGERPPSLESVKEPPLGAYVEGWMRPGDFGVLLSLDGQSVGAAWARRFSESNHGYGWVAPEIPELSVAVRPEFRGRGLGTALLESLIQLAQNKAPGLSLSVSRDNPARRLYQRLGFQVVRVEEHDLVMLLEWDDASPAQVAS